MIRFERAASPPVPPRELYLDSLVEPQELFVERCVSAGRTWCFSDIASAVAHDRKLVEFFVNPNEANRVVEIFDAVTRVSDVSFVLCKSFDNQLLFAALSRQDGME